MLGIIVLLKGPTSPKPQVCDGLHHIVIQYLLVLKRIHGCRLKAGTFEWPSQSPDLNPIENLWWDLKKAVAVRKPKNVTELEAFAHDEWAKIPVDRCKTLVSSYASRLKAVITVKGCCTKY
uniref:Tc1-like transposase DDE domain-containing protein n=1 Tax=Leptobrachium leishanense TaxID=445787 RepID=A0A8C5Q6T5_9ANUR